MDQTFKDIQSGSDTGTYEQGIIIRGIGGFYYVRLSDGTTVECRARGKFRRDSFAPLVGDAVKIQRFSHGDAALEEILPRRNMLRRPSAANITHLIIVASCTVPAPDFLLVDKMLLMARASGIFPVLVFNKCEDLADARRKRLQETYACFPVFFVSALQGTGIDGLRDYLSGQACTACLAGQSAVGKSSIINALLPGCLQETGDVSRKTERGRHTTRRVELLELSGDSYILDTPGFSLYELPLMDQLTLDTCYPEFSTLPQDCYFPDCSHTTEPGCAVREAVRNGEIPRERYERYTEIQKEMKLRRQHQYD